MINPGQPSKLTSFGEFNSTTIYQITKNPLWDPSVDLRGIAKVKQLTNYHKIIIPSNID